MYGGVLKPFSESETALSSGRRLRLQPDDAIEKRQCLSAPPEARNEGLQGKGDHPPRSQRWHELIRRRIGVPTVSWDHSVKAAYLDQWPEPANNNQDLGVSPRAPYSQAPLREEYDIQERPAEASHQNVDQKPGQAVSAVLEMLQQPRDTPVGSCPKIFPSSSWEDALLHKVWDAAARTKVGDWSQVTPTESKVPRLQEVWQQTAALAKQVDIAEALLRQLKDPQQQELRRRVVALAAQEERMSGKLQTVLGELEELQEESRRQGKASAFASVEAARREMATEMQAREAKLLLLVAERKRRFSPLTPICQPSLPLPPT